MSVQESIKISDFFQKEFCKYASYDALRKLANYVDGLKISERKAMWVALNTSIFKRTKVSQFASRVSEATNYIHGEGSMQSVITNLGRNYTGSNNINLLKPDGNFGSRFIRKPSAPRYIFIEKPEYLDQIFNKADLAIVERQYFEGDEIEPYFLLPNIPLLLVNGSDGIGTGFRQYILPRNPKDILIVMKDILSGKNDHAGDLITPWFRGFKGKVRRTEDGNAWEILGHIYYKDSTTLIIDEVPINYELNDYKNVLDSLKDKKKIKSYTDLSELDNFLFEVKIARTPEPIDEEELLSEFKLIRRESEIFSCISEDSKTVDKQDDINSEIDIIKLFLGVKLKYIEKRKNYLLKKYLAEIKVAKNRVKFILAIREGTANIKDPTKKVVEKLESLGFDKIGNTYSYLLDMKIHTLTEDKCNELKLQIKKLVDEYTKLKESTPNDIFLKDLDSFNLG